MTTPRFYGITTREAVLLVASIGGTITQATVRKWVHRGNLTRTRDGGIDPIQILDHWNDHARRKT